MVRCVIALWVHCIWWFVRLLGGLWVFAWVVCSGYAVGGLFLSCLSL